MLVRLAGSLPGCFLFMPKPVEEILGGAPRQSETAPFRRKSIEEIPGIEKLTFGTGAGDTDNLKDNGVVTGWFSAAGDA